MTLELKDLADDQPLTLQEACDLFFRGKITPDSLRAESRRGTLRITRVGRSDWVTPAAIREFLAKWRVQPKAQGSTSTPSNESGSSETDRTLSAQAALKAIASELKKGSTPTSDGSSNPPSAKVISLGSQSRRS